MYTNSLYLYTYTVYIHLSWLLIHVAKMEFIFVLLKLLPLWLKIQSHAHFCVCLHICICEQDKVLWAGWHTGLSGAQRQYPDGPSQSRVTALCVAEAILSPPVSIMELRLNLSLLSLTGCPQPLDGCWHLHSSSHLFFVPPQAINEQRASWLPPLPISASLACWLSLFGIYTAAPVSPWYVSRLCLSPAHTPSSAAADYEKQRQALLLHPPSLLILIC